MDILPGEVDVERRPSCSRVDLLDRPRREDVGGIVERVDDLRGRLGLVLPHVVVALRGLGVGGGLVEEARADAVGAVGILLVVREAVVVCIQGTAVIERCSHAQGKVDERREGG